MVSASPLTRSSYHAAEDFRAAARGACRQTRRYRLIPRHADPCREACAELHAGAALRARRQHASSLQLLANPAVRDLTAVFQNISTTLEFGRRLDYYYHYQKLALEEELKRMEQMVNEKSLEELQAVAPILQRIVGRPVGDQRNAGTGAGAC